MMRILDTHKIKKILKTMIRNLHKNKTKIIINNSMIMSLRDRIVA